MIERGIDASLIPRDATDREPELVTAIVQDHLEVLEGLFAFVKGERDLTVGYIKEAHAALLRRQPTFTVMDQFGNRFEKEVHKGLYKTLPNNPTRPDGLTHEYCPPEQTASEMDRMVTLHHEHSKRGVAPEVEAAWLHHVFTQIHPFEDGNGRVARAVASLVFLKAGWFPLVITRDDRSNYIDALEAADEGDLKPLVSLFTKFEKLSVLKAMEVAWAVQPARTIDEAIAAARVQLVAAGRIIPEEWTRTAKELATDTVSKLQNVADKLQSGIGSGKPRFEFNVARGRRDNEILEVANQLCYTASAADHDDAVILTLNTERAASLVISFHGLGPQFRGLLAVSAYLAVPGSAPVAACDTFFQFNYKESKESVENRFAPWLEAAIVKGLELWRRQL
ncbi:MAG: Fic family protein [Bryobacteraceae bacterium]